MNSAPSPAPTDSTLFPRQPRGMGMNANRIPTGKPLKSFRNRIAFRYPMGFRSPLDIDRDSNSSLVAFDIQQATGGDLKPEGKL